MLKDILSKTDHTLLAVTARWVEIRQLCDEAAAFGCASVCIPPCYVARAAEYLGGRVAVCTVIGFPNGYNSTEVKCFEAARAVAQGAEEIDMVVNLGMVKDGRFDEVTAEIGAVKAACSGNVLKVIIETCLLTKEEKLSLCKAVTEAGADYIKTSTGFSTGGATIEDVELLAKNVGKGVLVKASGGIRSLQDAQDLIAAGAGRLGTSRLVAEAKKAEKEGN